MNREMLSLVDGLAREKGVPQEVVFRSLEESLSVAARKAAREQVQADWEVHVDVDRNTGEYRAFRVWEVVEDDHEDLNPLNQIKKSDAKATDPTLEVGSLVRGDALLDLPLKRIGAYAAKHSLLQKMREAEREQTLSEFIERGEKLFVGTVKKVDRSYAILEANRLEVFLPRDQMIPKENLRVGDRIKASVLRFERTLRGPRLLVSRTSNDLLEALFRLEVPEIASGGLEIKAIARDPGLRAKIAVISHDPRIEPVGTCVGVRGSRVQLITHELAGERVDIAVYSDDLTRYVSESLKPVVIQKVVIDEAKNAVDAIVDEENMAAAIGRSGQNVRLASELTGWQINLLTQAEADQKREAEESQWRQKFAESLDLPEDLAALLSGQGVRSIEEIAEADIHALMGLGFTEESATELQERATTAMMLDEIAREERLAKIEQAMLELEGMSLGLANKISIHGVFTRDDLANLSADELMEISDLSRDEARELIKKARAHWFAE